MKRYQSYFLFLSLLVLMWSILMAFRHHTTDALRTTIITMPWYFLICLGCYCLAKLGLDIYFFNDFPQEIPKLEKVNIVSY